MNTAALQAPGCYSERDGSYRGQHFEEHSSGRICSVFYKNHSSCHVEKRQQRRQEKGRVAGPVWLSG